MSVDIWYGRWPETEAEQDALMELYRFLKPQDEYFLVMVQFHAGASNEIDWVIVKSSQIFVVELKYARDRLVGSTEGDWKILCEDGTHIDLRTNPLKQVKHAYWRFSEWCKENENAISNGVQRPWLPNYKKGARSFIVITPDLHPNSKVEVAPPTEIVGLSKFLLMLMIRSSPKMELSRKEIERFPMLLQLKKWEIIPPTAVITSAESTKKLEPGWSAAPFTGLIALGHSASVPVLNLDRLGKDAVSIGRGIENDLIIEDDTVSRHHAVLRRENDVYTIEDIGSTSGTFINYKGEPDLPERKLDAGKLNAIRNHSTVRFGQARFIFLERQ
jgi:hypothetical protein